MKESDYPGLFRSADDASNNKQNAHLSWLKLEYGLLLLAAILSMELSKEATYYTFYAFVFVGSIAVLLARALTRPVQDWYKCRALAESVKTLTWRYMLKAAPFHSSGNEVQDRKDFVGHLRQLFEVNKDIAEKINPDWAADDQITQKMSETRLLPLRQRKEIYQEHRIANQAAWYTNKAKWNARTGRRWVIAGVSAYIAAMGLVLLRIAFPKLHPWPIEPVIVIASSILGWMQVKRFGELSAAYKITAVEIGLFRTRLNDIADDDALSDFVNETELAFSREHTLWIARQVT